MFRSHSHQEVSGSGNPARSPLELPFGIVLFAAWIGFIVVLLLGPGAASASAADDEVAFEQYYPVALDEQVTDPPIDLEEAFWQCEHAAARQPVDDGAAAVCSAVTEELKAQRFEGDFDQLLAWWREHKDAEYAARDAEPDALPLP